MTVILRGASPSFYWVKSASGGLRAMIASYMTNNDYIFSWQFPFPNYIAEPFYCADFIAALNNIRNSGGFATERVYHVQPGATPATDQYQNIYFVVAGRPLSSYPVVYARCNFTQTQSGVAVNIPQLSAPLVFVALPSDYPYRAANAITIPANTGRDKTNAICWFEPYTTYPSSLVKE